VKLRRRREWERRVYEVDGLVADVLEGDGRHGGLLVI
jgi:hypothetical protein